MVNRTQANSTEIPNLEWLNSLSADEATDELLQCCGSRRWAGQMADERPFSDPEELREKATDIWWSLDSHDWLEAFRSHPKIGENKPTVSHETKDQLHSGARNWSEQEQAGVRNAKEETIGYLAQLNLEYEAKFGYIFIVCATGKSSEEMLTILRERLENDEAKELPIAAAEQAKITDLRLKKFLGLRDQMLPG
jgi:OHCU decarboxylase